MKLYEINEEIARLTDTLLVDEETGEIVGDTEEFCTQLEALNMEKRKILEYLAKLVLNTRSDAEALKTEEQRLKARREKLEKKAEKLLAVIDRECGEKTDLGVATLSYRASTAVEVTDSKKESAFSGFVFTETARSCHAEFCSTDSVSEKTAKRRSEHVLRLFRHIREIM